MAELVVPPLVRAGLAAHALSPGAGEDPLEQVRLVTEAIRHRLLNRRGRSFGMRLGGHLGVREFDTAFQQLRLSEIALVERLPILVIARGGVLRVGDSVHERCAICAWNQDACSSASGSMGR